MIYSRLITPVCIAVTVLLLSGCGPKPPKQSLPAETSVGTLVALLERQASAVNTFSGWAKVRAKDAKDEQSATAVISYRRPNEFKTTLLLSLGGMELAEIASLGDSVIAYIPFYNGFISAPKEMNPLSALVPGFDISLERLFAVINGPALPPGELATYRVTVNRLTDRAELIFERAGMRYRYLMRGPQSLVTEETVMSDSTLIWSVTRGEFTTANGVAFPRRILLRDGSRSLQLDFTSLSINSGLPVDAFTVTIPEDAQRLPSRNR